MGTWAILGHWAVSSTVQTGLIVILLSLITRMAGRHLSARWIAPLWLLVLVRLAVPWSPSSWWPISPRVIATPLPRWALDLSTTIRGATMSGTSSSGTSPLSHVAAMHWPLLAMTIWGLGACAIALRSLQREYRFRRALAKAHHPIDIIVPTPRGVSLYETPAVQAPAAFGLRHPQILVPPGIGPRWTPD